MRKRLMVYLVVIVSIIICLTGCKNKIIDSTLLDVTVMTNYIGKSRIEVNDFLGDEIKSFYPDKREEVGEGYLRADGIFYTKDKLMIDSLHLQYNMLGDEATLKIIYYNFKCSGFEQAESVWKWLFEQKKALELHFGRLCDFTNESDGIPEAISIEQFHQYNNFEERWYIDIEDDEFKIHQNVYSYSITLAGSEEGKASIIVSLKCGEVLGM